MFNVDKVMERGNADAPGHVTGRNVISNATTMFSGVVVTMQYRRPGNFIELYVKLNITAAIYNVDCFRFVGRRLELLVMSHHCQCWGMLLVVSCHQNCRNRMRIWCLVTFLHGLINRPDFFAKFQSLILVSGRHIGFPVQHRTIIFMAFCSPAII